MVTAVCGQSAGKLCSGGGGCNDKDKVHPRLKISALGLLQCRQHTAPSEPFSLFFTLDSFSVILLLAQCTHVKPFNTNDLNGLTSVYLQNSRLLDNLLLDQELRQWHSRGLMYGKQWELGEQWKLGGDHLLAPIVYP